MDQKLARYFVSLKEETETALRGGHAEISEVISDISTLCGELVAEHDISLAIALILDPEKGVFSTIDSLLPLRDRSIQKARESCLLFLAEFVKSIGTRSAPYVSFIKEKCLSSFRRDESKSAQAAALVPLISLLELSMQQNGSLGFSLDRAITEVLVQEYAKAKSSGTLRSNILVLLGYAVECFPHQFGEENVNSILKLCLDTLEEQLHQKGRDPVYILVAGAVKCLDALLTWFDATLPAGGSVGNARRIYAYLEQVLYFREDLRRYEMVKAGLHLLSRHAGLFRLRLLEDSMNILKWLEAYCTHVNAQLRDASLPAFIQFISEVAFCLASDDHRIKNPLQVYKRLISYALGVLDSEGHDLKISSLAIHIVGKLSPLVVKFSGKEALLQAFHRLISFGTASMGSTEMQGQPMNFSVTLVGAFSDMVIHVDDVENYIVTVIAKAVGSIFYGFPYLFQKQKTAVYNTLDHLFKTFYTKGPLFSAFLSNIVWSSLERAMEPVKSSEGVIETALWKHYVEIWTKLLDHAAIEKSGVVREKIEQGSEDSSCTDFFHVGTSETEVQGGLQACIFDTLLKCIIKAMTELDLTYKVKTETINEKISSQVSKDLEPDCDEDHVEPLNDFHMKKFLNLVEFVQELLSSHFGHLFSKWTFPLGHCLVELSSRYPLISGFYKLLAVTIKTADTEGYFNVSDEPAAAESMGNISGKVHCAILGRVEDTERQLFCEGDHIVCQLLFRKFLQEVLVSSRRYKLELLASCLRLCLSSPPALIGIPLLVEPLKNALKIGLTYTPLAAAAIDSLEKWHELCPSELEPFLFEIVPYLSKYLYDSQSVSAAPENSTGTLHSISGSGNLSSTQLKQIKAERLKEAEPSIFEITQVRIQRFLGRIGKYNHYLVPDINLVQVTGTGGLAWDTIYRVKFTLPFRDEKPDIWLDPLLPRIVELAMSSSDRRTKVAACELLHAVSVLMLGNAAKGPTRQRSEVAQSVHYEHIYKRIFPAIIRLASDVEQVTRDLFHKLVMQMIHWFTSNVQKENPECMALLDSIFEGLVDSDNAALRELCASCFEEFMYWSIRHSPPEVDNFVNVASMLRRLYNRLDHPNPYHRLGAAMATIRMHRVLRDNKAIVDKHIFEILFFCIKSLRIGEFDNDQIGTGKQLSKTLETFQKLVKINISSLQQKRKDRSMFVVLEDFLDWLFKQTGKLQDKCRTKCMWLFSSICEALPAGTPAGWFSLHIRSKGCEDVLEHFDIRHKLPLDQESRCSIADTENWMRYLCRSLHWFEWALKLGMISLKELPCKEGSKKSHMPSAIKDFIKNFFLETTFTTKILTPAELEAYESLKYRTVMYLLCFIREVLCMELGIKEQDILFCPQQWQQCTEDESIVAKFIPLDDPNFHKLICLLMLLPQDAGFHSISLLKVENLMRLTMNITKILMMLSSVFKQCMLEMLQDLLGGGKPALELEAISASLDGYGNMGNIRLEKAVCLLKGYQHLLHGGLFIPTLGKEKSSMMGARLLNTLFSMKRDYSPALEQVMSEMLTLSLALGVKASKLLELVFDQETVASSSNASITAGNIFYMNFQKAIVQQVKFSYKECLLPLLERAPENQTARLLVIALLDDYLKVSSVGSNITVRSFLQEFLQHLVLLKPCCTIGTPLSDHLFFLEVLHKLLMIDSQMDTVLTPNHPAFNLIIESYSSFLGDSYAELSEQCNLSHINMAFIIKCNALVLLPYFFRAPLSDDIKGELKSALTRIATDHLLVQESDLPAGSNQRAMYIQMLNRLLEAVASSKSFNLLEVLFPLLQNPTRQVKRRILDVLEVYAENIGDQRALACDMCLSILSDSNKVPTLRQAVIECVLSPIISVASPEFIVTWYANHIKDFVSILSKHGDQVQQSAEKERDFLIIKTCHYSMIELLFSKGDALLIKDKVNPLVSNPQLIQLSTSDSRAKNDPGMYLFPENAHLWRALHVAAYNCLAAIVMCTQDQEKIFTILFKDFAGKPLWLHLVDCSKVYDNFPVETLQLGLAQNLIAGLQTERRVQQKQEGFISSLSSQYIVGATISQEPALIESFIQGDVHREHVARDLQEAKEQTGADHRNQHLIEVDVLDQDDFDQHPCMPTLLKLIGHLHSKFGDAYKYTHQMPEWMKSLYSTLEMDSTPINIRLFISKVVIKTRKIFAPFSVFWFRPLVQVFLIDPEKSGGKSFHYMLRDVCITILEWKLPSPPDESLASRFVNHLMTVTPHGSKQVLKANLEILKIFFASWKGKIVLDRNIIASYLKTGGENPNPNDKTVAMQKSVGLQLLGALVIAGLPFYNDNNGSAMSERESFRTLLSCTNFKVKNVYEASAELLGILLKQQKEQQPHPHEQTLESPLRQMLVKMFRESEGQFLSVMDKITMHFPSFLEGYSSMVFDLLPRVYGTFKIIALNIILRCPSAIPNLPTVVMPFLSKLLVHRDELAQLKSLQLVAELVKDMEKNPISEQVLPVLYRTFSIHESVECRQSYYQILNFLYTRKGMEEDKLLMHSLLVGLCDTSALVRGSLREFWHEQLSKDLRQRFIQMINQMYDPAIEDHWAYSANSLLLKLCEDSVDYKRPIFNAPLSDCEFREYSFDKSLLSGTLPMTPMFSDTQRTTSQSLSSVIDEDAGIHDDRQPGMIRATVEQSSSLDFPQSSQTSASSYTLVDNESSLLAMSPQPSSIRFNTLKQEGDALVDSSTNLKRRILHASVARPRAVRGIFNAIKRREARVAQQALERVNKVQMMRRYRIGDLPDIEIKHEEIIGPIVILAERDSAFSNILITLICHAVYSLPPDKYHPNEHELKASVSKGIERALEKTQNKISFIGCALSLALEDKEAWMKPKVVGSASKKSTNYQSGILFLENSILRDTAPWEAFGNASKRHRGVSGQVTREAGAIEEAWLELAHLYKCIGEDDVVLSLYKKHICKASISHHALEAQLGGNSARALQLYDKAINQFDQLEEKSAGNSSDIEQDLWYVQRLHCMADLLDWHGVLEEILFQVGESNLQRLWEPKVQDPYLSFFIRASIKMPTHYPLLMDFQESASEDLAKRDLILNEFGLQMATLAIVNNQFDHARFYIHQSYRSFRKQWNDVHPLTIGARHLQVRQLQKAVELSEFVDLASSNCQSDWKRLISVWRRRWPSTKLDNVEAWDDIVQNRLVFFQKFQSLFNKGLDKGKEDGATEFALQLDRERSAIYHQAAKGVMKQGAFDVAKGYMNQCIAARGGTPEKEKLDYVSYKDVVKLRCLQAFSISDIDKNKAIQMLQQVLSYIRSTRQKPYQQKQFKWRSGLSLLEGNTSAQLAWLSIKLIQVPNIDTESMNNCLRLFGSAFEAYSSALEEMVETNAGKFSSHAVAKASLKFAFFCDELFAFAESSKWDNQVCEAIHRGDHCTGLPPASAFPSLIVKHIMKAVQLDSSIQAHHGIARVLALVGQHIETQNEFSIAVKEVPNWLFIAWMPQMLAVMNKEEGEAFIGILEEIAKEYPQALYYAFNISKTDFGAIGKSRTQHLEGILTNPLQGTFIRALEDLTFPEQRLRDGLAQLKNCLVSENFQQAQKTFLDLYEDCLSLESMMKANRCSGEYNIKFARDYSKRVLKALGENGSKLLSMNEKEFNLAISDIMTNLQKVLKTLQVGKISLGSLSKWLADFDQSSDPFWGNWSIPENMENDSCMTSSKSMIEIPGKYNSFQKPNPSSHVKLVGFDQTLLCLTSKQRPKILKMRGSNEVEYKFVVKGGEDLRLDQRIEQLFEVMNSILNRSPACSQRKLFVQTYSVIPVSKQCGLLQFVENTRVLEDVIKDGLACTLPSLERSGKNAPMELLSNLRLQYQGWLEKRGASQNLVDCYKTLYTKVRHTELADKMNALTVGFPWDALKTGLFRLTTSAESFLALRSQYQHSLAVLSICGYIAGVGDRHLSNTLVDIKSGLLVPIDFGYSFGTGVILLPVPELIPFRMTHQLVNVMLPQDAIGLLRNDMIHTMSALRASRNIISAVLDVFVKEPLVEWKTEALRAAAWHNLGIPDRKSGVAAVVGRDEAQANNEQHHVELKIENAHRKLELWNPAEVTISELHLSIHANKPYMRDLEQIVRGHPDRNIRARIQGTVCESVQEQVDCLIDQATDPNLLGRIWVGWQPWV